MRVAYGEKKARPIRTGCEPIGAAGVCSRLPAHARLAPARLTVVRMRMMVDASDRHAGNLTATRERVNVTARGMHALGTNGRPAVSGRFALTKHCE